MYCLRDYEAILVWSEEVELERMPDAARPVNGCNVSHVEVFNSPQKLKKEGEVITVDGGVHGCIPSLRAARAAATREFALRGEANFWNFGTLELWNFGTLELLEIGYRVAAEAGNKSVKVLASKNRLKLRLRGLNRLPLRGRQAQLLR
jgi:hypothetical protein